MIGDELARVPWGCSTCAIEAGAHEAWAVRVGGRWTVRCVRGSASLCLSQAEVAAIEARARDLGLLLAPDLEAPDLPTGGGQLRDLEARVRDLEARVRDLEGRAGR